MPGMPMSNAFLACPSGDARIYWLAGRRRRDINILAAADTEDSQNQYQSSSTSIGLMGGLSARFTMFGKADASQNGENTASTAHTEQ